MNTKQKREFNRRAHWYGRKTVKKGQKTCWIAKEDKNGWAIGLTLGPRTLWLRNFRVSTEKEVERIVKGSIVFIHLLKNQ